MINIQPYIDRLDTSRELIFKKIDKKEERRKLFELFDTTGDIIYRATIPESYDGINVAPFTHDEIALWY
jgi:hypothetical protein